jgi:uncharacterized Fe-S cluster-containing radical SAM superfamily protein
MPVEGVPCASRDQILCFEEITRAVKVASHLGLKNVRLTGGEPLLRRELPTLIAMLKAETDVADIAMTTNALLLARHAQALADAGPNLSCQQRAALLAFLSHRYTLTLSEIGDPEGPFSEHLRTLVTSADPISWLLDLSGWTPERLARLL